MTWIYTFKKKNTFPQKLLKTFGQNKNDTKQNGKQMHMSWGVFCTIVGYLSTKEHVEPGRVYDMCGVSL
jgi:hypothetical protein